MAAEVWDYDEVSLEKRRKLSREQIQVLSFPYLVI